MHMYCMIVILTIHLKISVIQYTSTLKFGFSQTLIKKIKSNLKNISGFGTLQKACSQE